MVIPLYKSRRLKHHFTQCIRNWTLNASHMTFYGYGRTFEVHFERRPFMKRVICFACLNLFRNCFEYEYEHKQSHSYTETVNYKNAAFLIFAVTGNLNTNKTELKFLVKLCIWFFLCFVCSSYSTANSSSFSHDANICFRRSFVNIYMFFLTTTLCCHSNRIQTIFVYIFTNSARAPKLRVNFDGKHMSRCVR